MVVHAADFVGLLLAQKGDRYVFGHRVSPTDWDPEIFDCSELAEWATRRLGVQPRLPDGSWLQARHCRDRDTTVPVSKAVRTQGALLFIFKGGNPFSGPRPPTSHVAISLGNGSTIEARGKKWGVGIFTTKARGWTHAALVPGIKYAAPPPGPNDPRPAWPGIYITQPPAMTNAHVKTWQLKMKQRGWDIPTTGRYGRRSEEVCRAFQREKRLEVDGVVGPETWKKTWTAPVT